MKISLFQIALVGSLILATCAISAQAQDAGDNDVMIMPPSSGMVIVGPDGQGVVVGSDGLKTPIDMSANGGRIDLNDPAINGLISPAGKKGGVMVGPGGPNMTVKGQPIDPQQLRRRSSESLKQLLACGDDEWSLIGPKIEKVQILQRVGAQGQVLDSQDAGFDLPEAIQVRTALTEFQKVMKDENASSARVSQALAALRDARAKARSSLVQARKELTDLLTPKQEAILYQRGILD